jgi:hypothetical protein
MRTRWPAVLLAIGLLVAGCGSDSGQGGGASTATTPAPAPTPAPTPTTEAGTATASAELCADAADLQAALNGLSTITVGPGAATELQNDLRDVQSSLTTLVTSARVEWQDEITTLQASLTALQTAVGQLAGSPSTATVAAASTALQEVRTATRNLFAAVSASCPSLTPAPTS